MLLDREVFWIRDQVFFMASLGSAVVIFLAARLVVISPRFFLIPDAAGLAAFSVAGTMVSLMVGAPWLVYLNMDVTLAAVIAGASIFITRLLALYYNISLPKFRFKPEKLTSGKLLP